MASPRLANQVREQAREPQKFEHGRPGDAGKKKKRAHSRRSRNQRRELPGVSRAIAGNRLRERDPTLPILAQTMGGGAPAAQRDRNAVSGEGINERSGISGEDDVAANRLRLSIDQRCRADWLGGGSPDREGVVAGREVDVKGA